MSTTETVETSAPAANVQAEQGSLEAGFNKVRGEEPPVDTPQTTEPAPTVPEASTEVTPATPAAAAPAAPAEEEPTIGGFKESEFKTLLAKAQRFDELEQMVKGNHDKVHGKIGELTRTLKAIQEASPGQTVKIAPDSLKRLREQFPEIAEMLAEDLSGIITAVPAQNGATDFSEIEKKFDQRLAEETELIRRGNAQTLLSMKHPDWEATVKGNDFKLWLGTLPTEERDQINNSWDPAFVSKKIDSFNQWTAAQVVAKKKSNEKRLAANVVPQGTPAAGQSTVPDSAGLSAGFNKVRRVT